MRAALALLTCLTATVTLVGAALPESATIVNSGSTNFMGWNVTVGADGSGSVVQAARGVAAQGQVARPFRITHALATKFFRDLRAARDTHVTGMACMKSVSFGTRLNVVWHGWVSPDLSCPSVSVLEAALREDVSRITAIADPPSGFHRIFLPVEPRRPAPITPSEPPGNLRPLLQENETPPLRSS